MEEGYPPMTARYSLKDLLSGLIFIAVGLAFGYAALGYTIGTALRMGPGYFPLILSGIIIVLGLVILVQSIIDGPDEIHLGKVPWAGMALIIGALVFFGLTVRGLGLLPSLFFTVTATSLASKRTGFIGGIVISALITLLCLVIFVWALGLPLPVIGRWLAF